MLSMPRKKLPKSDGQLNIRIPTQRLAEFDQWCMVNNYDPKFILLGGWACLKSMDHDERMVCVNAAQAWLETGEWKRQNRRKSIKDIDFAAAGRDKL